MNIITTIPIYRNHFQHPVLNFSDKKFSIGSLVFTPYLKNKEKPALVIEISNLQTKKFLLRKYTTKIEKINNFSEFSLLKKKIIELILLISQKTNLSVEEILQKLFSKKIIREINQLSPTKVNDLKNIQKFTNDKLTPIFITKKILGGFTPKSEKFKKTKGVQTIETILSAPQNQKTSLHSEKHYLVDEIRNYFGETAKKGIGSFSFYLGFFKKIPKATIYQYWSEVKESRKPIKDQQKLFWWRIGQYIKKKD